MSSSDGQPPLTRRQVRDLERAREAGQAVTGAIPVPASAPASMPTPASVPAPAPAPASAAAPASAPAPAPTSAPAPASAPAPEAAPASTPTPASTPAPGSTPAPSSIPTSATAYGSERGLTRRELRALREAQSGKAAEPVPLQPPGPEPRRPLSEAFSAVDEIIAPTGQIPRVTSAPSSGETPGSEATSATSAPTPALRPASFDRREPSGPAAAAPAAPVRPVVPTIPASAPESNGFVPPVGHWTTQSSEPDGDTAPGRALGTHTGQTNALILTDQQVADVTGALNATGEIIITGSIDLPRSLGATGSQARVDSADIDRLLEQGDAENAETDAVPVRASRAISTHTSTRAVVLAASQPKASRLPLFLGIGGGIIGAGIIGVVVAGFASGILGQ
ncbi:hypothetical protein [Frigoribacterium sp. Leaf172]|uniref:hypothetical protein n=1 Tax=Frigoribacterium sp. Leaf172 TaxID=1736285 RepID=UPI0006F948E0|nr:hypothetical protein [Frigoribacterium sp. Leaf172]KQR62390.1 hypothetical protein ASF89_13740 [Frigoribacterium sp. Leaf172]